MANFPSTSGREFQNGTENIDDIRIENDIDDTSRLKESSQISPQNREYNKQSNQISSQEDKRAKKEIDYDDAEISPSSSRAVPKANISVMDMLTRITPTMSKISVKSKARQHHTKNSIKIARSPLKTQVYCNELIDIMFCGFTPIKLHGDNPFVWDGSYLGRICNYNIEDYYEYGGTKYWKLNILGHEKVCILRSIDNGTACVCDELKTYFGLSKLGTHRVKYHGKMYLLIEAKLDSSGDIFEEITINNIVTNDDPFFMERTREIFAFREIFGLTMTREKSIIVRWSDKSYIPPYPVSYIEKEMKPYGSRDIISGVVERKWFGDVTIDEVVRSMMQIHSNDDISDRLLHIRGKIEDTIERIDRSLIWVVQPIIERLLQRLSPSDSRNSPTPSQIEDLTEF